MFDIQEIKEDVEKVLLHSQSVSKVNIDELMDTWLLKKRDFIEAMDGKLIYELPNKISFELDEEEKYKKIVKFRDKVYGFWKLPELEKFLSVQKEGFFSNTVILDYTTPEGEVITKGTKLVKAFKHFTKDQRLLCDIQNAASMIIQENKIEGKLCVSVHPLDYLSSSETTYNWRSCHSLDGEYRAGNLSYMLDNTTLICYLKSDNEKHYLPNFPSSVPWNSKKWRVLMFMSNDWTMLFAGRQYPFRSSTGLNHVLKVLLTQAGLVRGEWSDWSCEKISNFTRADGLYAGFSSPYIPLNNGMVPMNQLVIDAKHAPHYNDLLFSSCYDPEYSVKIDNWAWGKDIIPDYESTRFNIGSEVKCIVCGKGSVCSDSMLCEECYNKYNDNTNYYCECCGARVSEDEIRSVAGELVCDCCYDRYVVTCEECGEDYFKEDITYNAVEHKYLCSECSCKFEEEEE